MPARVVTIGTVRELAQIRTLARMLVEHDATAVTHALLLDDVDATAEADREPFVLVQPIELGLDEAQLRGLALAIDERALRAHLKPAFLRAMLERTDSEPIVFLAPHTAVYGDLEPLLDAAAGGGIALVPRVLELPPAHDGDRAARMVAAGALDENCFAIAPGIATTELLAFAQSAIEQSDHRHPPGWLEHALALVPKASIVRDPGLAVAAWNLAERSVRAGPDGIGGPRVGRHPLRTIVFSGFDPRRPGGLAADEGGADLAGRPELARLCFAYARALWQAGWDEFADRTYGFDADAEAGADRLDLLMIPELEAAQAAGAVVHPVVMRRGREQFLRWLTEPSPEIPGGTVSRFWARVAKHRPDVERAFPELARGDSGGYLSWAVEFGVAEHSVPAALWPSGAEPKVDVVLVTDPDSRAAGPLTEALSAAGVGVADRADRVAAPDDAAASATLLVLDAANRHGNARTIARASATGACDVAYVTWELEGTVIPGAERLGFLREVWVPSEHVARGARRAFDCPVVTIPAPVRSPRADPDARVRLGLGDEFVVVTVVDVDIDVDAGVARCNPTAAIEAFDEAFDDERARLVIACYGAGSDPLAEADLYAAVGERPQVTLLHDASLAAVLNASDCILSLHRAVSFGPVLAQALALGKPVVATGYSGNMEYMRPDSAYLVDAVIRPAMTAVAPLGLVWADPDTQHAADQLRRVREDPVEAGERARRGMAFVLEHYSPRACGAAMRDRLSAQLELRGSAIAPASASQT